MKKLLFSTTLAGFALALVALAQTKPSGQTKALSHAIHAVDDLDTTLAFYKDVFGLNGTPQDFPNKAVPLLTNAPGVTLRLSMLALPGMRFELTHFKDVERKGARGRIHRSWSRESGALCPRHRRRRGECKKGKCANRDYGAEFQSRSPPGKGKRAPSSCAIRTASSYSLFRKPPRTMGRPGMCNASALPIRWKTRTPPGTFTPTCWASRSTAPPPIQKIRPS